MRATVPNIAAGASKAEIVLKADATARVATTEIQIRGEAVLAGKKVVRIAALPTDPRDPPIDHVAVAVAVPTPFKFTASYDQAYTPRGTVQVRHYHLERNGFAGPLQIRVADKQVRYKQGVNGPTIVVPAGADHFDYPLTLAPFMEILRTSRTNVMATGIITDPDGSAHPVTYTTEHQDEQIVAVVSPGRINLTLDPASVEAEPRQIGNRHDPVESGQGTDRRRPVRAGLPAAHRRRHRRTARRSPPARTPARYA